MEKIRARNVKNYICTKGDRHRKYRKNERDRLTNGQSDRTITQQ